MAAPVAAVPVIRPASPGICWPGLVTRCFAVYLRY